MDETWHGYDVDACQWLMEPRFQNLEDRSIQSAFADAFLQGGTQARVMFTGHNREADTPDCLYVAKLVRRPHIEGQCLFVIRVNPATMSPMDVREVSWKAVESDNNEPTKTGEVFQEAYVMPSFMSLVDPVRAKMGTVLKQVFDAVALWHKDDFGVGPVAPSVNLNVTPDPDDVDNINNDDSHERFTQWQKARLERTTKRDAAPSASGPRL